MRTARSALLGMLAILSLAAPASAAEPAWAYLVDAPGTAAVLHITAHLVGAAGRELSVNDKAEPYVERVEVLEGLRWVPIPRQKNSWFLPAAVATDCHLRYDYQLRKAAEEVDNADLAAAHQSMLQVSPGAFLLRPIGGIRGRVEFKVTTYDPVRFVTGIDPAPTSPGFPDLFGPHPADVFAAHSEDLFLGPDCAFGPLQVAHLTLGGCALEVAWLPHSFALDDAQISHWLVSKLNAVVEYFGRLPLPRGLILVVPVERDDVEGHAAGGSGFSVLVGVGRQTTLPQLMRDWTFTHEMVHVCTPSMPSHQHWMEEGIATYLEPIIRVRVGDLTAEKVWHDMIDGLPKGQPAADDRGLNRTHTWGRTYWGGCGFWFLADLDIRIQTHNQKSLRDALRAFMEQGASIATNWEPEQVLEVGDKATGTHVFHDLYAQYAVQPAPLKLDDLWSQLGIKLDDNKIVFSTAVLSPIRDAITRP